jgi:hypothetical protein
MFFQNWIFNDVSTDARSASYPGALNIIHEVFRQATKGLLGRVHQTFAGYAFMSHNHETSPNPHP